MEQKNCNLYFRTSNVNHSAKLPARAKKLIIYNARNCHQIMIQSGAQQDYYYTANEQRAQRQEQQQEQQVGTTSTTSRRSATENSTNREDWYDTFVDLTYPISSLKPDPVQCK